MFLQEVGLCVFVCVCVSVCICTYVCVYVKDKQRDLKLLSLGPFEWKHESREEQEASSQEMRKFDSFILSNSPCWFLTFLLFSLSFDLRPLFKDASGTLDKSARFSAIYRQDSNKLSNEDMFKLLADFRK